MNDSTNYLNTRQAADWLGLSARTLDRYRVSGEGPVFHRFGGRVRYLRADLDACPGAGGSRRVAFAKLLVELHPEPSEDVPAPVAVRDGPRAHQG